MAQRKAKKKKTAVAKSDLIDLTVVNQSKLKISEKFVNAWANKVAFELQNRSKNISRLKNLNWLGAELTIAFLNPAAAAHLNQVYRERDYATDVLSFANETPGVLGELAICPQVVKRQALEHDLSFEDELGYMILHGILHLLGFDHEANAREEKIMLGLQDEVFEVLRR